MKTLKYLVSAALVMTSVSPAFVAPAYATIDPSSTTTSAMASQCANDLGANAGVLLNFDGSHAFTTEVVEIGQVDGPTTEVSGSRVETPGSRIGTGTATYSGLSIVGDPYRVGGSVNMFGQQGAMYKNWSNSEYDFIADYSTTTTISYECHVTEQKEVYHPAVHIPGHPVLGYYVVDPDFNGNEEAAQNSCNAFNAQAPVAPDYAAPGFWGSSPQANCVFVQTEAAQDPVDEPAYWTLGDLIERTDLNTSHTVDETNIAEDVAGHEVNGGPWTQLPPPGTLWNAAQVVICISPSKTVKGGTPGAWANHNGYTGSKCTTSWFNVAPWGAGTSTSNGTYISVPGV